VGGEKGDYIVHPVDVDRLQVIRNLSSEKQDPLKPDIIWVTEACGFLIDSIRKAGFLPELIIGVAFGGLFPASFISATLRIPFLPLRAEHYNGTSKLPSAFVFHDYYELGNVPIWVIDDIADTGETLEAIRQYVVDKCGVAEGNLRFATLHLKDHSKFIPNWYVDVVNGWVCYPWEASRAPESIESI